MQSAHKRLCAPADEVGASVHHCEKGRVAMATPIQTCTNAWNSTCCVRGQSVLLLISFFSFFVPASCCLPTHPRPRTRGTCVAQAGTLSSVCHFFNVQFVAWPARALMWPPANVPPALVRKRHETICMKGEGEGEGRRRVARTNSAHRQERRPGGGDGEKHKGIEKV